MKGMGGSYGFRGAFFWQSQISAFLAEFGSFQHSRVSDGRCEMVVGKH